MRQNNLPRKKFCHECVAFLNPLILIYIYMIEHDRFFCLHTFSIIFSNCRIDFMIFAENWLINLP